MPLAPAVSSLPRRKPRAVEGPPGAGLAVTMRTMWSLIDEGAEKPWTIQAAREAVAEAALRNRKPGEKRELEMARAIWKWIQDHIAFVMDPHTRGRDQELLADTENILRTRAGDCDEHMIILGSMIRSVGMFTRPDGLSLWLGGGYRRKYRMKVPQHVFIVATTCIGRSIPFDTTVASRPFGALPGVDPRTGRSRWKYWKWQP